MNQRGMITVDFLFAFVLVMGFCAILFAMSMTLVAADVAQYITFASARAYHGAHMNLSDQQSLAQRKFAEVFNQKAIKPLFSNGWFQIAEPIISDQEFANRFPEYRQDAANPNLFIGVGTDFSALILNFQIPFFGSTTAVDSGDKTFTTFIASYLGREPTMVECRNFSINRWKAIRRLAVNGHAPYTTNTSDNGYYTMMDDGC